jgi:hypothetical protein
MSGEQEKPATQAAFDSTFDFDRRSEDRCRWGLEDRWALPTGTT